MRNANVEQVGLVAPRMGRTRVLIVALAVAAGGLIAALSVALDGSGSAPGTAPLTRVQQAEADRLTGLAEAQSIADVLRGREAEAARWQARGEHYRLARAQQAEADRLTGLAEHLGVTSP